MSFIVSIFKNTIVDIGLTLLYRVLKRGYLKYVRVRVATSVDVRGELYNKAVSKLSFLDDEYEQDNNTRIPYVAFQRYVDEDFVEDEKEIDYVDFLRVIKSDFYREISFQKSIFDVVPPAFKPLRKRIEKRNKMYQSALNEYKDQVFQIIQHCGKFEYLSEVERLNLSGAIQLAFINGEPPLSAFFTFCCSARVVKQVDSYRKRLDAGDYVYVTVWEYSRFRYRKC